MYSIESSLKSCFTVFVKNLPIGASINISEYKSSIEEEVLTVSSVG